jgi:hypothetical protein
MGRFGFQADEEMLNQLEEQIGAERLDPLKTTIVEQDRSMTTWVLRKL